MPTYEYACRDCGEHIEVVQSFTDAPLATCGVCGGRLRKVFSAAGLIFKGSGYYVTDSRQASKDNGKASKDKDKEKASPSESSSGASSSGTSSSESSSDTSVNEAKSA